MGREALLVLALLALVFTTWAPRLTGPVDLRWDGGVYYVLGTSLAEGSGYRLLNEPGEIRGNQYPPLLPAVIALHQIAAGTSDPTVVGRHLRITYLLLSLALAVSCYILLRGWFAPVLAALGTALVILHTTTVFVSDIAFTELPYAVATVLFLLVVQRRRSMAAEVGAGLLAAAAFLLRTAGVALMAAWVGDALLRRQWRRAGLRLALVAPAFAGWQLYTGSVERSPEYREPAYEYQRADYLFYNVSYLRNIRLRNPERPEEGRLSIAGLAARAAWNGTVAPARLGETVTALSSDWRRQVMRVRQLPVVGLVMRPRLIGFGLALIGIACLAGLALRAARREYLLGLYVLFYVGLVCLTPWIYMERYWFPLAPILLIGLFHCAVEAGRRLAGRGLGWIGRVGYAAVGVFLLVQAVSLVDFFRERHFPVSYTDLRGESVEYRLLYYRDTYRALDDALDHLREEAPPGAIVAASMPHWTYLRTGLTSVKPPFETDPERALALLEAVPVDYVVTDGRTGSFTTVFALPALKLAPERWERVFVDEPGEVETYRRVSR